MRRTGSDSVSAARARSLASSAGRSSARRCCSASRRQVVQPQRPHGRVEHFDEQAQPLDRVEQARPHGSSPRQRAQRFASSSGRTLTRSRKSASSGGARRAPRSAGSRTAAGSGAQRALDGAGAPPRPAGATAPIAMRSPAGQPCVRSNRRSASAASSAGLGAPCGGPRRARTAAAAGGTRPARRVRAAARARAAARRATDSASVQRGVIRSSSRSRKRKKAGSSTRCRSSNAIDAVRHLAGIERVDDLRRDRAAARRPPRPHARQQRLGCGAPRRVERLERGDHALDEPVQVVAGVDRYPGERPSPRGSRAISSASSVVLP